jgi:adenine-specific DNA-methyltransferase
LIILAQKIIYASLIGRFNMKCLTGLLNSKLIEFCLKHTDKLQGNNYQIDKELLINIPSTTHTNEIITKQIDELVDKILTAKNENKNADMIEWEREIDQLVYKLYDLNEEEIKIIENK